MKISVMIFFLFGKTLKREKKTVCSEESKAYVEHMHI